MADDLAGTLMIAAAPPRREVARDAVFAWTPDAGGLLQEASPLADKAAHREPPQAAFVKGPQGPGSSVICHLVS